MLVRAVRPLYFFSHCTCCDRIFLFELGPTISYMEKKAERLRNEVVFNDSTGLGTAIAFKRRRQRLWELKPRAWRRFHGFIAELRRPEGPPRGTP